MRITFALLVLAFAFSKAQDAPGAALTAGSESLQAQSENQSITSNQPANVIDTYGYQEVSNEPKLKQAKRNARVEESPFNFIALLVAFILSGIAVYFIRTKIKNQNAETIAFETEEEIELKKEVWEKLASDTTEKNKDTE
ncbi:MAG: hypothetical protein JNK50_05155 [Bacteroidia bacterium]|nr:hypothetical protein [Bacteroidia bacterium]